MVSTTAGGERGLDVGKQPVTRVLMSAGRAEHWPSLGNASTRAFSASECSRRCVGGRPLPVAEGVLEGLVEAVTVAGLTVPSIFAPIAPPIRVVATSAVAGMIFFFIIRCLGARCSQ